MTLMPAFFAPTPVEVKFSAHAGRATPLLSLPRLDHAEGVQEFRLQSHPLHGCVTRETDGRLFYVAQSGYVGPDRFVYSVGDPDSPSTTHFMVQVEVVRSGLVATAARWAHFALRNDTMLVLPEAAMLRTKPDAPIEGLRVASVEQPRHGSVIWREDGCYTYTPQPGYVGPDTFDYLVIDLFGKRALVMVKLDLSAPSAAPTLALVPAQQAEVCDRLLQNAPLGALQPTLQGEAMPGSLVTVVVDGRAVARVAVNGQGRWFFSSEHIALRSASHLQAYAHTPDGCVVATCHVSGKSALGEASAGSGHWASCTSRSHRSGYHGKNDMVPGGYHGGLLAWGQRSGLGPSGWGSS